MSIPMADSRRFRPQRKHCSGAVLFVALIVLILLTLLGITAAQVTVLQERMSGNFRVQQLAFERSEGRMAEGRDLVSNPLLVYDTISNAPVQLAAANESPWASWLASYPPTEYPPTPTTALTAAELSVRACGGACPGRTGSATGEDPNKKPHFYVITAQQKDLASTDVETAAWATVQTIYVF